MPKIKKNVVEKFGIIGNKEAKMPKQLTITEWGVYEGKFDIRGWDEDYDRCTKGISFTAKELIDLRDILNKLNLEEYAEKEEDDE